MALPRARAGVHRGSSPRGFLGLEAGGTRTTAVWVSDTGKPTPIRTFGPANLQLLSDPELLRHFRAIAAELPRPRAVGIGMAGARTERDRARIRAAAARVWPGTTCVATHDLASALAADEASEADRQAPSPAVRILVLSGTGSCCFGQHPDGRTAKVGGWGHLLGDQGSGYAVALQALRSLVRDHDLAPGPDPARTWGTLGEAVLAELHLNEPDALIPWIHAAGKADVAALAPGPDPARTWGTLGEAILAELHLNEPDALIPWIHAACKADVAALAPVVLQAATAGDRRARQALDDAAASLAEAARACAERLAQPADPVRFVLAGGMLGTTSPLARAVTRALQRLARPGPVKIVHLSRPGAEGAAYLARQSLCDPAFPTTSPEPAPAASSTPPAHRPGLPARDLVIPEALALSPTEERNPRSMSLDRLALDDAIDLMLDEDRRLPDALLAEKPSLSKALRFIVRALRTGGRLFYVGAGTSGRLGVLDASECPPTFRTPPELVQGIIAGGEPALCRSVEGAEDDFDAGGRALAFRQVTRRDVVVGIAASGRTPFVWGALAEARRRGARTVLVAFNPNLRFRPGHRPDAVILPRIGPELLTGSTRLKSGTATKQILNLFTTLAMVRLGKVVGNLMVDVNPANTKLRERAIRIVRELRAVDEPTARTALERSAWIVKKALHRLRPSGPSTKSGPDRGVQAAST